MGGAFLEILKRLARFLLETKSSDSIHNLEVCIFALSKNGARFPTKIGPAIGKHSFTASVGLNHSLERDSIA